MRVPCQGRHPDKKDVPNTTATAFCPLFDGWARIVIRTRSNDPGYVSGVMLAFTDDRQHKAQLSVVWDVTATWSIQLGAFSTVGQEQWRERGALVAIWRRF